MSWICPFCSAAGETVYRLNGYDVVACSSCRTAGVLNPPEPEELERFYDGFRYKAEADHYELVNTPHMEEWMRSLLHRIPARMLDIGGGGGYFARAFEDFGFGESVYIDLDAQACAFASSKLGLTRVVQGSVEDAGTIASLGKFDFMYCRHVIEHLIDPVRFIEAICELIAPSGVLVLQCPNGRSREGLLFPHYWKARLKPVFRSNPWSRLKTAAFSLTEAYAWGLDPVRHLWAISSDGMSSLFADRKDLRCRILTASLVDPVYSPYWKKGSIIDGISGLLAMSLVPGILEGMHLIAIIRREE